MSLPGHHGTIFQASHGPLWHLGLALPCKGDWGPCKLGMGWAGEGSPAPTLFQLGTCLEGGLGGGLCWDGWGRSRC